MYCGSLSPNRTDYGFTLNGTDLFDCTVTATVGRPPPQRPKHTQQTDQTPTASTPSSCPPSSPHAQHIRHIPTTYSPCTPTPLQVLLGNTDSCAAFPAAPAHHRIIFACEAFTNVVMLWGAAHAMASACRACALPRADDAPRAAAAPKRQRTSNVRIATIDEPRGAVEVHCGTAKVAAAI
eukprot:5414036-Prymnesium_polylepis.1